MLHADKLRRYETELTTAESVDYERLANLKAELLKTEEEIAGLRDSATSAPVTEQHLAGVVELWTGIPASKIRENELDKLADLEAELKRHIIGQDEAVRLVSAAIRRSRV